MHARPRIPCCLLLGALVGCPPAAGPQDSSIEVAGTDKNQMTFPDLVPPVPDLGARDQDGTPPVDSRLTTVLTGTNPVITGDHPDPHVVRLIAADNRPIYYLTATATGTDLPLYSSRDLVHWALEPKGLFQRSGTLGSSIQINDHHYCYMWAPQIVQLGPGSFLLSFTANRYKTPQSPCPAYVQDGGVYVAWSSSVTGPFAPQDHPWEPLPVGGQISSCPASIRDNIPHSVDVATHDCPGDYCHKFVRLDSDVFRDDQTGRYWLGYAWFTNMPGQTLWELLNIGEHVHLTELDAKDPFTVICDLNVPQIAVANPHDGDTVSKLKAYCPRCGEMLAMNRDRENKEVFAGVTEAPHLFRHGAYVYLLMNGSAWDSAYYHVFWVAAKTVEELAMSNSKRLVGRYLIPSKGQSFGHGTTVLGPDGKSLFFVHHRLDNTACRMSGQCGRDVFVSPLELEDRGDGLGPVHIKPRFPAEETTFQVALP